MSKQINTSFSIAKGLGIILMVIGHSGAPSALVNCIYTFHMPLFFIISGYFFKEITTLQELIKFSTRRLNSLWKPFFFYNIAFLLLYHWVTQFGYREDLNNTFDYLTRVGRLIIFFGEFKAFPAFWFLRILFVSSILLATISYIANQFKKTNFYIYVFVGLVATTILFTHYLHNSLLIKETLMASIFLLIGVAHRRLLENILPYNLLSFILCFLTCFVCSYIVGHIEIFEVTETYLGMYILIAYIGSIGILSIAYLLDQHCITPMKDTLVYIGNHTMVILALHGVAFKIMNNILVPLLDLPNECKFNLHISQHITPFGWILYTFVGVAIPIMLCLVCKRIKEYFYEKNFYHNRNIQL